MVYGYRHRTKRIEKDRYISKKKRCSLPKEQMVSPNLLNAGKYDSVPNDTDEHNSPLWDECESPRCTSSTKSEMWLSRGSYVRETDERAGLLAGSLEEKPELVATRVHSLDYRYVAVNLYVGGAGVPLTFHGLRRRRTNLVELSGHVLLLGDGVDGLVIH